MRFSLTLPASLVASIALIGAPASVRVVIGPTPIQRGNSRAAGDITVVNERFAFALAVETGAPGAPHE